MLLGRGPRKCSVARTSRHHHCDLFGIQLEDTGLRASSRPQKASEQQKEEECGGMRTDTREGRGQREPWLPAARLMLPIPGLQICSEVPCFLDKPKAIHWLKSALSAAIAYQPEIVRIE